MEISRRSFLIYALLAAAWVLVAGWQVEEHLRVTNSAKTDLRNRSKDIANTLSAIIRGLRFRGTGGIPQSRLDTVLNELVNGRTNELVKSSELISIVLLNAAGQKVAFAGKPVDLEQTDLAQEGERWGRQSVTLINPVDLGAALASEGVTNPAVVLPPPPPRDSSSTNRDEGRPFTRREPRPEEAGAAGSSNVVSDLSTNEPARAERMAGPPRSRDGFRRGRPPWLQNMGEEEYQALREKKTLHGLVLAMSTDTFNAVCTRDFWLRTIIMFLATFSVLGSAFAWSNLAKSAVLQIRLVRASELNTHLKELNLAAAGLAHETRNPLNIIRGLAQMISKQPEAPAEIREKSRSILEETDKVTAQLNEFINYSRPREVRPSVLALNSVVTEVVRTLNYDLDEKKIRLQVKGDVVNVEADEQLLRQALFNLLLNAIQAVDGDGQIEVLAERKSASEAALEVRDNGPGVPWDHRSEIFKPYFTTQKKGTGLGLAVVQQIVLAHGWEIECLANEPKGAVFRITHLKVVSPQSAMGRG